MRNGYNVLFTALSVPAAVNGFVSSNNLQLKPITIGTSNFFRSTALSASRDNDESSTPLARNMARTCVRNFLTQRSIQSFMFLLEQCRDPHTVKWLEQMYGWKNLLSYHGTGAFNMTRFGTWDSVLSDIVSRPADKVVVSVRSRQKGLGWSKNNPYAKKEERFVEFEIDIDPSSLASRIMSVREQIAAEWNQDLDTIFRSNELILTSYFDKVMDQRDEEEDYDPDSEDGEESEHNLDVHSLTAPYSSDKQETAFDRNAMQMLLDDTAFEDRKSSPLRKGSFDLLILLSTQESIHRVLRQFKKEGEVVSFEWLRGFYTDRLKDYFDGNQHYGAADDFLEELLLTPPSVKKDDGNIGLIDPLGIAEEIIRTRGDVSREWKQHMSHVPQDHMDLRKALLARQVMKKVAIEPQKDVCEEGNFE